MKVTPLDLRKPRFRTAVRGFDKAEVAAFLIEVADDYEQAIRETDRLQQEVARLESLVNEHREHERDLRNTLLTAQRVAEEMKTNAEQEAARIVREAEGKSALLIEKARSRADAIEHDVEALKMKRRDAEASLELAIATLRNALQSVREQDQRERGGMAAPAPWPAAEAQGNS